jgi:hypothetical protein
VKSARELLERYVEAKDDNRPALMADVYRPEAVLNFSIATDEIRFPGEVHGVEAITRTLIVDFGERFVQCRTYCICETPPAEGDDGTVVLPWLVIMREAEGHTLRVGKGYYRWQFERDGAGRLWVRAMHIFIVRMAAIAPAEGERLMTVRPQLPYPWLQPAELCRVADRLLERDPELQILRDFREPVAVPHA